MKRRTVKILVALAILAIGLAYIFLLRNVRRITSGGEDTPRGATAGFRGPLAPPAARGPDAPPPQ